MWRQAQKECLDALVQPIIELDGLELAEGSLTLLA